MSTAIRWALPALAVVTPACLAVIGYEDARPGWTASSTHTGGAGGTGGTGGTSSSSGTTGGACPGGASACATPTDCPALSSGCATPACEQGCCGSTNAPSGTTCDDGHGGKLCDGNGACVACLQPTDCPGQDTQCQIRTCIAHVCDTSDMPAGTKCNESGGTACNPSGSCVGACADGVKDGTETDIDCGGASCAKCANGQACSVAGDCASGACTSGTCGVEAALPSCAGGGAGRSNCGPSGNESCCAPLSVPGGTFNRSYDGVSPGYTSPTAPATVSGFRLDKYAVTVGRFRQFVLAWDAGWRPAQAAGKHTHINGGGGLNGGTETGWDTSWAGNLATTADVWNDTNHLACSSTYQTWTPTAGNNEKRPIGCITWYEAYAFCIWDGGGFLPSEAEWNYAAAGGNEQRVYPWSSPASSMTIDCSYANYKNGSAYCFSPPNGSMNDVGAEAPKGNGKWGHADLAGNAYGWVLDWYLPYPVPCNDCANLTTAAKRVFRGGSFRDPYWNLLASFRAFADTSVRIVDVGARCARGP